MIFDQNKEKFQPTASSGQPQENPKPLSEMSAAGPEKQDKPPTVTYLPKPDTASMRPVEPVKSSPDPVSREDGSIHANSADGISESTCRTGRTGSIPGGS